MAKRGANEGSIYKRADGRWAATINLGWTLTLHFPWEEANNDNS